MTIHLQRNLPLPALREGEADGQPGSARLKHNPPVNRAVVLGGAEPTNLGEGDGQRVEPDFLPRLQVRRQELLDRGRGLRWHPGTQTQHHHPRCFCNQLAPWRCVSGPHPGLKLKIATLQPCR